MKLERHIKGQGSKKSPRVEYDPKRMSWAHYFPGKVALILVISAIILAGSAIGQTQKEGESIGMGDNQAPDINEEFEDIEYTISEDASPGTNEIIIKPRTQIELYLSLGVLAFGLVLIILTGLVALRRGSGWDQEATRIFAVSVIVTAGLFLITAGYSDQQIAPMFGLLGTIVGYLLGKSPHENKVQS